MKFYYTTSVGVDTIQDKPNLSLGGFKSLSPVLNSEFNNLFSELSALTVHNNKDEYIALMLVNETGKDLINVEIWTETPVDSYSLLEISAIIPATNSDGGLYIERVATKNSKPFYADFKDSPELDKYVVGDLSTGDTIGVWVKRSLLMDFIETDSMDVYQEDPDNYRQYIVKEQGTEDLIKINLNWEEAPIVT